jgi:hypothetical protein
VHSAPVVTCLEAALAFNLPPRHWMKRDSIVDEYFQLKNHINRANKLSNQSTELQFEIEEIRSHEYGLFVKSFGNSEKQKLMIAILSSAKIWERAGYTSFQYLEEFCADCLNKNYEP